MFTNGIQMLAELVSTITELPVSFVASALSKRTDQSEGNTFMFITWSLSPQLERSTKLTR